MKLKLRTDMLPDIVLLRRVTTQCAICTTLRFLAVIFNDPTRIRHERFCCNRRSSCVKRISYLANKDDNMLFPSRASRFTRYEQRKLIQPHLPA